VLPLWTTLLWQAVVAAALVTLEEAVLEAI